MEGDYLTVASISPTQRIPRGTARSVASAKKIKKSPSIRRHVIQSTGRSVHLIQIMIKNGQVVINKTPSLQSEPRAFYLFSFPAATFRWKKYR